MAPTIDVRKAQPSDRATLLGFHRSLYESHRNRVVAPEDLPLIAYRDYQRVLRDDLDSLLRDRGGYVLVAELGGVSVGYITGRTTIEPGRVLSRKGVVEDWFVDPDARGQGVGAKLLEALEQRFKAAGCELIESATWTGNTGAREAHAALGFREIRVMYRKRL